MARASGRLEMTGNKDREYRMSVEFSGDLMPPHSLRTGGYYLGKRTSAEMIEELSRRASTELDEEKADVTGSVGNVGTVSVGELRTTVESQSSTESPKPATPGTFSAMDTAKEDSPKDEEGFTKEGEGPAKEEDSGKDNTAKEESTKEGEASGKEGFAKEVSERANSVVGLQPHLGPFAEKPARAMGRAPIGSLRRDLSSDEVETEVEEFDDYYVVGEDSNEPVSLCLLPLELEEEKTIGGSVSTTELFLLGKSNGVDVVMRQISAWKLTFPENMSFQILVKITQMSDAKWVKLGKPRSGFKETAGDAFFVAKVLALLKKEPQASEDRVWNHLLEGDVAPETFRDHLSKQYSLMQQFIKLDPVLKEADAQKTLLSLFDREKEANSGKRVLSDRDSSEEVDNRPVKKFKAGNVVQRTEKATRVGTTSYAIPEDVNMGESDSEEEYYAENEADESDEEFGDSFCIFCDDGGELLCCDGPCMRSFHATKEAAWESKCKSLGFTEAAVAGMVGKWLCKNCTYKRHQCYVCEELGASTSDESLGVRQEVFVCNVACCGKFYHPKCIASRFAVSPSERETLAENIQAGKESFTCPLHTCKVCGKGENREEDNLILAKCRRCPTAWHKKCLPRTISFAEDAVKRHLETRAWTFGENPKQYICYCPHHKLIETLGTPKRNHVKFGLSPEEARELEEFGKQKQKAGAVTKEPARYGAKTSSAASMGRSAEKKYPSADLIAKARPYSIPGSFSVPPPPRPNISKDAVKKSDEAAQRIVQAIVIASKENVTEETVKCKLENCLPGIYKPKKIGNFMKMGMIDSILEAARAAVEKIGRDRALEAMTICDRKTVLTAFHEEERLRTYLAPTLFGKRYTSYGRHFTKVQKLQKVVEILQPYIWERDTIVDFSCGDNSFCRLLREALPLAGKNNCQFKNYDIFPSKDSFGFEQKNWLEVGLKDCGPGENLVIGLNPPFAFVEKFLSHALGMNPRLLVLIVPPMKKNLEHLGFECIVDDETLMAEKSFYLPGSVNEKNWECLEQGNNVAPHFFIYCSKKLCGRYKVGGSGEGPSTATNPSAVLRKSEKPAKPPPLSEPTANLFIPSSQQRPQPGQTSNQKKVAPRKRDPRQQPPQVPSRVPRPLDSDSREEGEIPGGLKKDKWPVWRLDDQVLPPPPLPPPPPFGHMPPRGHPHFERHPGPHYPPYHTPEYNPFEPELFAHGSPPLGLPPPFRPQHNGYFPPRHEQFYQGPSPSRNHDFPPGVYPEDDDGGTGGWIYH